ncbi:MAG: hypothetical protein ACRCW9_03890 [Cetobacterium sp.]
MINKPSVPSPNDVILGDGIIYKDYGLATQRELGACSGDSKFTVGKKFNHVDYNGQYGDTKDLKYKTRVEPKLTINLLSISPQNLKDCFAGLQVSDQTNYYEITESVEVVSADYWTNLTFIGETKSGNDVVIIMDNVLGDMEKFEMVFKTDNHVITDVQFTGHYGTATPTTPPYKIRIGKSNYLSL